MELAPLRRSDLKTKLRYYKKMNANPCVSKAYKINSQLLISDIENELKTRGQIT